MKNWLKESIEKFKEFNHKKKALFISGICIIVITIGIFTYESSYSYQLKFNSEEIGIVQGKAIAESILLDLEKQVAKEYGEQAYYKGNIKINKVRVAKDKLSDQEQLTDKIFQSLEIYKPAAIVMVDGEEKLVVDTKEQADELLETIKNGSLEKIETKSKNIEILKTSFNQDVQIISKDVLVNEILTNEEALNEVEDKKKQVKTHKVALGDNAWNISRSYSVGMNTLQEANTDKDIEDLMPGDTVNLVVEEPFLEVSTVVKQTEEKEIAYKVEKIKDATKYVGNNKVKQNGKNGEKIVTSEITYINNVQKEVKVIGEETITPAINKVVIEGTKKRPVQVRATYSSKAAPTYNGDLGAAIVKTAKKYLGIPYRSGGSTPAGFDCSGFTSYVYRQYGISIPRTSGGQRSVGSSVSRSNLKPGDLVTFSGHVGIYVGNSQFIHSPRPGKRIMISSLNESYWRSRFISGRRV